MQETEVKLDGTPLGVEPDDGSLGDARSPTRATRAARATPSGRHDARPPVRQALDAQVGRTLAEVERELVLATLTRCAGNRTWAADLLGLAPLALREKLLEYRRADEEVARTVARREATLMMDADLADGPRPTHIPPARFLA